VWVESRCKTTPDIVIPFHVAWCRQDVEAAVAVRVGNAARSWHFGHVLWYPSRSWGDAMAIEDDVVQKPLQTLSASLMAGRPPTLRQVRQHLRSLDAATRAAILPPDLSGRLLGVPGASPPSLSAHASRILSARSTTAAAAGPASMRVVVAVPGIMASELKTTADDTEIWLSAWQIIRGHMSYLALSSDGENPLPPEGATCDASDVLASLFIFFDIYSTTFDALEAAGLDVIPAPFDWRKSVSSRVGALRALLQSLIDEGKSVSLLCHSMGGLLGILAAFDGTNLGTKLERILVGGVPFLGSFGAPDAFLGNYEVVKDVADADLTHTSTQIAEIVATFPGLHDLMPQAQLARGAALARDPSNYPQAKPVQAFLDGDLDMGRRVLAALATAKQQLAAGRRLLVVAGTGPSTPCEFLQASGKAYYFVRYGDENTTVAADVGDGTVLLDSATANGLVQATTFPGAVHYKLFSYDSVSQVATRFLADGAPPTPSVMGSVVGSVTPGLADDVRAHSAARLAELKTRLGRLAARGVTPPRRTRLAASRAFAASYFQDHEGSLLSSELALNDIGGMSAGSPGPGNTNPAA